MVLGRLHSDARRHPTDRDLPLELCRTDTFESKEMTQNLVGNVTWQVSAPARLRVSGQYRPLPSGTGYYRIQTGRTIRLRCSRSPANSRTTPRPAASTTSPLESPVLQYQGQLPRSDRHDQGIPNEIRYIFASGSNNIYETRPEPDSVGRVYQHPDEPAGLARQVHARRLERRQHVFPQRGRSAHLQGRRAVRAHRQ